MAGILAIVLTWLIANVLASADPGVSLAIAPWLIPAILSAAQTAYGLFAKKPKRPKFPDYQEMMSPELEAQMMEAIQRRIGTQTNQTIQGIGERAAQRGFYRSGQLPALEGKATMAGTEALSDAALKLELDKAARRQRWAELKAGREYGSQTQNYDDELSMLGDMTGGGLSNLANLAMLYGGSPKPTTGTGTGQGFFGTGSVFGSRPRGRYITGNIGGR